MLTQFRALIRKDIRLFLNDRRAVLMSGDATIDSAVEAVKLGAIDYLTKPFDIGRLKGLMRTVHDEFERRRKLLAADGEIVTAPLPVLVTVSLKPAAVPPPPPPPPPVAALESFCVTRTVTIPPLEFHTVA